ncbi:MAG TPA: hypothetical protein DCE23_00325 [Firmicutes bacterium]|nr:hypothetical protein [Bacillota bacterium]
MTELIISLIIIMITLITKAIVIKKRNLKEYAVDESNNTINKCEKKISLFLSILSLIIFISVLIYDKTSLNKSLIDSIVGALTIALIVYPINFKSLHKVIFFNELDEKNTIKTIVSSTEKSKYFLDCIIRTGLNVILIKNTEKNSLGLKKLKKSEINKETIKENFHYRSSNIHALDEYLDPETTYYETEHLDYIYEDVYCSRKYYASYILSVKHLISTYLPLILSYIILNIIGFNFKCSLLLVALLKVVSFIIIAHIYDKLTLRIKDVENRNPKSHDLYINSQELIFSIIQGLINFFMITIPYIVILSMSGDSNLAICLYTTVFIFSIIFSTISYDDEDFFIRFLIDKITGKRRIEIDFSTLLFFILLIISSLIFNIIVTSSLNNIGLKNYITCICFGFSTILFNELIKLARYFTEKGRK